ncbi:hypothetical protein K7432_002646 [Basidiobolus ranarum]|uniref:EF-hand domain-containing protein n=1 Tax=Basidiobolus ranarum TaxID=34480 RepID=A0ABR2W7H2_9FUNG
MSNQEQVNQYFRQVDTDGSGEISADELQKALLNGDWSRFDISTVKLMIDMFDKDDTGTIGLNEFFGLWQYIGDWQKCFVNFDANRNGSIEVSELQNALRTFGYNISMGSIQSILKKFLKHESKASRGSPQATQVNFENFLKACITIKMITDSFKQFDTDLDGQVSINYEQYIQLITANIH